MTTDLDDINGRLFETMLEYASFRLGPGAARELFAGAASATGSSLAKATDARGWTKLEVFHAVADAYRPLLGEGLLADAITWAVPVRRDEEQARRGGGVRGAYPAHPGALALHQMTAPGAGERGLTPTSDRARAA